MSNLFTEEKYNALYQAFKECAEEYRSVLEWVRCSYGNEDMIVSLVDKLEELGYIIIKKI